MIYGQNGTLEINFKDTPVSDKEAQPAIEFQAPDILPYAEGNTGVPYVWSFQAEKPGPSVLVTAVVHGNEQCGAVALDHLFQAGLRPRRGTLTLAFCNVEAYRCFNPARPTLSRFIDEDFNRLWSPTALDAAVETSERRRAREIRPFVEAADYLLDLHSMTTPAAALTLAGTEPRGRVLAQAMGVPTVVVADAGHAAGPRMRDFGGFSDPQSTKTALLVECGQHWEARTAETALRVMYRFLVSLDLLRADEVGDLAAPSEAPQTFVEVTEAVTVRTNNFQFILPVSTHEVIPQAGTAIARDGDETIRTAYENCVVIMPAKTPGPGATAVRLGRIIPAP